MFKFIERKEESTNSLVKVIKRNNIQLIYICGTYGIGKKSFALKLSEKLKSSINSLNVYDISFDFQHYSFEENNEEINLLRIINDLLPIHLSDPINSNEIKDNYLILSIYHLEILFKYSKNYLDSFKYYLNFVIDLLPKCFIIVTSRQNMDLCDCVIALIFKIIVFFFYIKILYILF